VRRRDFVAHLGGAVVAWPLPALAQTGLLPVVGVLRLNPPNVAETFAEPLRRYMKQFGWEDGSNVRFSFAWADGRSDRIPALADELVAQKVDVLVGFGDPQIRALQRATATIPIVGMSDDMIAGGLAASMARPGGNTTGVSILASELDTKRLEVLHEFVPRARRIGILMDPTTSSSRAQVEKTARALGLEPVVVAAENTDEIARALDNMEAMRVEAVNVLASPILNISRGIILHKLSRAKLPAIYQWPETCTEGGFLAYGPRLVLCYRLVISFIDKVLRGAKPIDLPIEQPTRFDLVVNVKTAKALGLIVSTTLLARADKVIE
jgi:putative tryptophan/tyrosine transport system substrate-binding protein